MLEPVTKPVVVKQGKLSKLGGGGGGHKNWRDRWFVLRYSVSHDALSWGLQAHSQQTQ